MAGMLNMASRNLSRPVLRALNECISKKTTEVGTRSIQHAAKLSRNSSQSITRHHRNVYDQGVKYFRTSTILRDDVKIVACPGFPESVAEGDVKYIKKVGDPVKEDDVICEIETDKTAIPVPSPSHGIIAEIMKPDGSTVKPGDQLFKLKVTPGPPAGAPPAAKPAPTPAAPPPPKAAPPAAPRAPAPTPGKASSIIAMAKTAWGRLSEGSLKSENDQPPGSVAAAAKPPPPPPRAAAGPPKPAAPVSTIPVAAIRHAQTLEAATVKLPPQDPTSLIIGTRSEQRVKMNRMRMKIAQRLKDAQNTTAMLTTFNEIDMSFIMDYRKVNQDAFVKKHGVKLGFMSVFCKAAAYALQDQPVLNAVIEGNEVIYKDYIDISIAVATPKGLVVPVLRNVERLSYADIEKEIAALGEKAKKGTLAIEDMDGGTFTISNGGVFGSLLSTPIINMPQSAILGMHGVFDRPIAVKGQAVVRPMMYIALSYDHRLIDGREAVMFLRKIKSAVEDPRVILTGL